jgi:hypothetical protein
MKKSTLITTIAMIVVVVVALSTATYAWFSSSTSAVASSTTITTTAAGDWTIAKATLQSTGDTTRSFVVGQAADSIELSTTGLNSGLWSPIEEIATTFNNSSVGVSGNITGLEDFIEARITNGGAMYHGATGVVQPDVLKLSNAKQTAGHLRLSVVLNAGSDTTKVSSFYACAAIRFYAVFEVMNGQTYEKYTVSNAYKYANASAYSNPAATEAADSRVVDTTYEKEMGPVETNAQAKNTVINNINYLSAATVGGVGDQFKLYTGWNISEDNLAKYGIGATDYIYMYDYDLPVPVGVGQSTNVLIYTWIDGWQAATEAAGSAFTVNYAFNSTPNAGSGASGN